MRFDDDTWTRLVWDTNRMRKPTQREFHTSAQERHQAPTVLTETAASELAGIIDPRNLQDSLAHAYESAGNPDALRPALAATGQRNIELYIQMNIWWAEEWLRADSPYEVRVLNPKEREHANELLEHLAHARVFPKLTAETARSHPDAIIICETAALGRHYVMTQNMEEAIGIGQWTRDVQKAGLIDQDEIVVYADEVLRTWCIDHPGYACESVATAFWPDDKNATDLAVEQRVQTMVPKLREALLVEVANAAERELEQTNDWPRWVERMRATLPERTRAADRRHPTHPNNRTRDWTRPTQGLEEAMTALRWQVKAGPGTTVLSEYQGGGAYRTVRTFPLGAEQALGEFLVDHDIELEGLPPHRGRRENASEFMTALRQAVEAQRARTGNTS